MQSARLIYALRHGQTDWNLEGRFQGSRDVPLNTVGEQQAERNGILLRELLGDRAKDFDYVASPLERARETMERVRTAVGLPARGYRTDERLTEVSFGDWEANTLAELKALDDADRVRLARRADDKWDFQPPGDGAESYEILSWRVAAWLKSVHRPTVCVSHGGIIRCLFHLVGGMERNEAADLPIPQDRVLKVEGDRLQWLPDFDTGTETAKSPFKS